MGAMSVPLVRNLLEPVGFRATSTREDLTEAESHRPGSMTAPFPGTALVAFRVDAA